MAFDTSLLDKAKAERRQAWERQRRRTLVATLELLEKAGAEYGLKRAYLFGSIVKPGRFHEGSDVDIAVSAVAPETFFELMGTFSLALGRDVDLVDLQQCHFAHRIREEGILWTRER